MLKDYTMTPNRAGIPVWRPAQPVIGREDEHQTALTNWARMMRTQYHALTLYHHIPNGGLRDKRTAARLIGQGVHSGVPDVFIPAARAPHGMGKRGRQTRGHSHRDGGLSHPHTGLVWS